VGEHVGASLLAFGEIDKDLAQFIRKYLTSYSNSNSMFLDIGANIGAIVLRAALCGCRCVAFEPQPELVKLLSWNAIHNSLDGRIKVRNVALGHTRGTLTLSVSDENCGNARTSYSGDGIEVPVSTLMQEFSKEEWLAVTMIKIDVEGFELEVLRGGKELFEWHRPLLVSEVNNAELSRMGHSWHELVNLLKELGYQEFHALGPSLYPIRNGVYPVWNVVASTDDHRDALVKIGIDVNFRPPSFRHFPVSIYEDSVA
jgi:FkbM family methyltransferase